MIFLLFVPLAIGVGLILGVAGAARVTALALEEANRAHANADAHAQAAQAATQDALAHAQAADTAPAATPARASGFDRMREAWHSALAHTQAADHANSVAVTKTAEAANTAATPAERAQVVQSAQQVAARDAQIQATRAQLGAGQCGARSYPHVTTRVRDALLARLRSEGMTVTGTNPYRIETHEPGLPFVADVELRALWDATSETLHLIVTAGRGSLVTCDEIWKRIEPKLTEVTKANA